VLNELLQKGLGLFPAYFRDLIALVTGPKRFVAAKLTEDRLFEQAFIFLGISYGFGFILKATVVQQDVWREAASGAAFTLLQAVSYGSAIWLAWRAVGGIGSLAGTLVVTFYYTAVVDFILVLTSLGLLGVIRSLDPPMHAELLAAVRNGTVIQFATQTDRILASQGVRVAMMALPIVFIMMAIWLISGWGGYRAQHGVDRIRSIPAFLLFMVLWVPVTIVLFMLANALVR
jgi:hypothetical protein